MSRSFLQTKDWAQFQQAFGRKIFWIEDKLVVKFDLPLGKSWLYAPRVELKTQSEKRKTNKEELFIKELSKIAIKENTIFVKVEPNLESSIQKQVSSINTKSKILNTNFQILASECLQPQDELVLDISQSEEKILAQMHPKTRYNIRLAQKKGLKIVESINPKDITHFYNLAVQTSQKNHFKYHSKIYYEKMLKVLGNSTELKAKLLTAFSDGEPTASLIMLINKDMAYYLHGASDHKYHNLMSTFILQWEAIKKAKKMGCKRYNFGGISPIGQIPITNNQIPNKLQIPNPNERTGVNPNKLQATNYKLSAAHAWSGITRFKLGFAPLENSSNQVLHYPDAYDIIYQLGWYWLYKIAKKLT